MINSELNNSNLSRQKCYCINPNCTKSQNVFNAGFCENCDSELLLDSQYIAVNKLDDNGIISTYEIRSNKGEKILKVLYNYSSENLSFFKQQITLLNDLKIEAITTIEPNSYFCFFPKNNSHQLHCVVMAKYQGQTLTQWLEKRGNPINDQLAINWLLQLIKIIGKLHSQNIIHGDLNPNNIILTPTGELIIVNICLLPNIYDKNYAAKERVNGYLLPQSDFFSLGCIFIYLLTNKEISTFYDPFEDKLNWRNQTNVNGDLIDFIDYLTASLPKKRPQNAEIIKRRLIEIEQGFGITKTVNNSSEKNVISLPEIQRNSLDEIEENSLNNSSENVRKKRKNRARKKKRKFIKSLKKNWIIIIGLSILFSLVSFEIYDYLNNKYSANPFITINSISKLIATFGVNSNSAITQIRFSLDGQNLATTFQNNIDIWNIADQEKIGHLKGHNDVVNTITFSPNNNILVSGSSDKSVKVWDIFTQTERKTFLGHQSDILAIAISPDGNILASASNEGIIILWNLKNGKAITTIKAHQERISSIVFTPDGKKLVSGSSDTIIKIWDVENMQPIMSLKGHELWINTVKISADGQIIASAGGDGKINLWDINSGKLLNSFLAHNGAVNDLSFSNNQYLVSGGADKQVKIWNFTTGKLSSTFVGHDKAITAVEFSPDSKILASGDGEGIIKLWKAD